MPDEQHSDAALSLVAPASTENNLTLDRFLHPQAALTPGTAGLVVMMMAVGIRHVFDGANYIALLFGLSFFVGSLLLVQKGRWLIKAVYYIINSFVIFFMSLGAYASLTGKTLAPSSAEVPPPAQYASNEVTVTTRDLPAKPAQ